MADDNISDGEIAALNESLKQLNEQGGRNSRNDSICLVSKTNSKQTLRKRKKSIDVETQTPKKRKHSSKKKPDDLNVVTDGIIEQLDSKLETLLEEKAMKNNLSVSNVKSILKNIICSPEVTDIFRNTFSGGSLNYEPKLTRSKAKQLLDSPLKTSKKITSETQLLMQGDLPEDSSDDEYQPNYGEEDNQSDDESLVSSLASDIGSPAHSFQECDIFKKPLPVCEEEKIVDRTRSKLPLTDTPLETLELAFVPPDITTDMYEFECEDDGWKNFLVGLQYPPAVQHHDDEDTDPDFNFFEDEEEVDREELRADRAVRVSRKEVKSLLAELFVDEELDWSSEEEPTPTNQSGSRPPEAPPDNQSGALPREAPPPKPADLLQTVVEREIKNLNFSNIQAPESYTEPHPEPQYLVAEPRKPTGVVRPLLQNPETLLVTVSFPTVDVTPIVIETKVQEPCEEIVYSSAELLPPDCRLVLEEQLRQHVQLLTQVHLITSQQHEFRQASHECKEMLQELQKSCIHLNNVTNLDEAVNLIETWGKYLEKNPSGDSYRKKQGTYTVKRSKKVFERRVSHPERFAFHPHMVQLMANSRVFIYPSLLPKLAFFDSDGAPCIPSVHEEQLLAMGLEQFKPFAEALMRGTSKTQLRAVYKATYLLISHYMLPYWTPKQIHRRIKRLRISKEENPVTFYLKNNFAPSMNVRAKTVIPSLVPALKDIDKKLLPVRWRQTLHPVPVKLGRPRKNRENPPFRERSSASVPIKRARTIYNLRPSIKFRIQDFDESSSDETNPEEEEEIEEIVLGKLSPDERREKPARPSKRRNKTLDRETCEKSPENFPKNAEVSCTVPEMVVPSHAISIVESVVLERPEPSRSGSLPSPETCRPPGMKRYVLLKQISEDTAQVLHFWGPPPPGDCDDQQGGDGGGGQPGEWGGEGEGNQPREGDGSTSHGEGGGEQAAGGGGVGGGGGDDNEDEQRKKKEIDDKLEDRGGDEEQEDEESDSQATGSTAASSLTLKARSPTHRHVRNQRIAKRVLQSFLADDEQSRTSDLSYAQAYFQKVRQVLNATNLEVFCQLLNELEQNPWSAASIYKRIRDLFPEQPELAEEFVIFFTQEQAALCGKQFLHFLLVRLRDFFSRIRIYLKDSPQQLKRITKTLQTISESSDPSLQDMKTSILPLLKGNAFLTSQFLQLFPEDISFDSLASDFEDARLDSAADDFEAVNMSTKDKDASIKPKKSANKSQLKNKGKGKSWKK